MPPNSSLPLWPSAPCFLLPLSSHSHVVDLFISTATNQSFSTHQQRGLYASQHWLELHTPSRYVWVDTRLTIFNILPLRGLFSPPSSFLILVLRQKRLYGLIFSICVALTLDSTTYICTYMYNLNWCVILSPHIPTQDHPSLLLFPPIFMLGHASGL